MAVGGVYVYCGRTLSYACFYHSLGFLTLCFGLIARDFNAVGYITLTKQGNKTGKYLFGQVFTVQKGLGTSVPARVRGGQAWLPLRDSLVTLGSTLSADPGPGLRFSPLRVTTPWSNTIVCLSLGRWQPRPPSHSAIVPDDVNSSSAGRGGEPLEQQTPGQIAEERAMWRRR